MLRQAIFFRSMKEQRIMASNVIDRLKELRNDEQRKVLMRFFKTGQGQYGEGDKFLGLKVPQTRAVVKEVSHLVSLNEIAKLLKSEWHEVRLAGFLLLVDEMKANLPNIKDNDEMSKSKARNREDIAMFYLKYSGRANNWDLVDLSCEYILGPYLRLDCADYMAVLLKLAESPNLWKQRIAVVTTLDFIRNGVFVPTLTLVGRLCSHPHDLIHKAMGWVLREVGKRDKKVLTDYLRDNHWRLPRTTLRYAIEKFPEAERRYWLGLKVS